MQWVGDGGRQAIRLAMMAGRPCLAATEAACGPTASGDRLEIPGIRPLTGMFRDFPLSMRLAQQEDRTHAWAALDSAQMAFRPIPRFWRGAHRSGLFLPASRRQISEARVLGARLSETRLSAVRASSMQASARVCRYFQIYSVVFLT